MTMSLFGNEFALVAGVVLVAATLFATLYFAILRRVPETILALGVMFIIAFLTLGYLRLGALTEYWTTVAMNASLGDVHDIPKGYFATLPGQVLWATGVLGFVLLALGAVIMPMAANRDLKEFVTRDEGNLSLALTQG